MIGDPGRIRQIIRNLITNALRYGGDQMRAVTSISRNFASVSDNGDAIPEDDRERIFERYTQGPVHGGAVDVVGPDDGKDVGKVAPSRVRGSTRGVSTTEQGACGPV